MCQNKDTRKAYSLMKKQLSLDENAVIRKKRRNLRIPDILIITETLLDILLLLLG